MNKRARFSFTPTVNCLAKVPNVYDVTYRNVSIIKTKFVKIIFLF